MGSDVGGFDGTPSPGLYVRWMQLGVFFPLMRANNARSCTAQEPWVWGEDVERACRRAVELRYVLLPYLYSCVQHAHRTGTPVLRSKA